MSNLAQQVPYGQDALIRKQQDAARTSKEYLASDQKSFAAAFTALQEQIANQISPQVNSSASTGFTLGTSYATVASFNFVVPTGYSRALIVASGAIGTASTASATDGLYARVTIHGTAGQESRAGFHTTDVPNVSAFSSASLSGLTAGESILITVQGHFTAGPGTSAFSTAMIAGQAMFLV